MNAPIVRLYALVALLFGVLVFATSWWSVFGASGLRNNQANRRPLLEEERVKRGTIRSADGRALARSTPISGKRFRRSYPTGPLFAHAIGYSFTNLGRSGLEQSRNDALTGRRTELIGALDSLLGDRGVGDNLRTTLSAKAQAVAVRALGDRKGAVVAIDPSNGSVTPVSGITFVTPPTITNTCSANTAVSPAASSLENESCASIAILNPRSATIR